MINIVSSALDMLRSLEWSFLAPAAGAALSTLPAIPAASLTADDDGWQVQTPLKRVLLITGEESAALDPVMRRATPQGWEYRACRDDELADYLSSDAW